MLGRKYIFLSLRTSFCILLSVTISEIFLTWIISSGVSQISRAQILALIEQLRISNFPNNTCISPTTSSRMNIAIVTIMQKRDNLKKYEIASGSIACYSLHHNYTYEIIVREGNQILQELCQQKKFMFQRHCIASYVINRSRYDYILFIDGDMGVINPMHRIEEYIVPDKDIIFYNRMWNFEIMAGSFIVRNSAFAINFLQNWARYDKRRSFLTDNAAIQSAVLDFSAANKTGCEIIWDNSNSVYECFLYEACARRLMEEDESWKEHITILPKGKASTRDCWLTNSKWSQRDFMLHGWQKGRANAPGTAKWILPFTREDVFRNMSLCSGPAYLQNWPYKGTLIKTDEQIQMALKNIIDEVDGEYKNALAEVDEYLATGNFSKKKSMKLLFAGRATGFPDFIEIDEIEQTLR